MIKYLMQVGYKVLPNWTDYSEYDNLADALLDIKHLKQAMKNPQYRYTAFRLLKIETTEIFNSKEVL